MLSMLQYEEGHNRRTGHILKVYALSKTIGTSENILKSQEEILEAAAILHDIGIKICKEKYGSAPMELQRIEGPIFANKMLENAGYTEEQIVRISHLIMYHHDYDNIEGIDFQILVEADLLINAFEAEWSIEMIDSYKKYFKTETGKKLLKEFFYNN